jgi:hypothetical protein
MSVQFVREPGGSPWRALRLLSQATLLGILSHSCVLDDDDLCGPNQVSWAGKERCVCAEGTAYTPEGCVACKDHEVASPTGCVCEAGFARSVATQPCAPIPEGVGTACTMDAECLNPAYSHCQTSSTGDGYCTSVGCVDSSGCSGGYACNTTATPSFCQRPPTGNFVPCSMPSECTAFEANFCEAVVSKACLVQNCTVEPDSCFPGTECCDLSGFGLPALCIPAGACQE